jgi:hypothetical protein
MGNSHSEPWSRTHDGRTAAQHRPSLPLTGGFRSWSLLPAFAAAPPLKLERLLSPLPGRWFGFPLLVAMQNTQDRR